MSEFKVREKTGYVRTSNIRRKINEEKVNDLFSFLISYPPGIMPRVSPLPMLI